jgi:hypothetical protein
MNELEVCRIINEMISNTVYARMKRAVINFKRNSKAIDKV